MIFTSLIFLLFIVVFVWLSGNAVGLVFGLRTDDRLINAGTMLTSGIVVVTVFSLVVRGLGGAWWWLWSLLPLITTTILLKQKQPIRFSWLNTKEFIVLVILVCLVFVQCLTLWTGLRFTADGLRVPALHDSMWNIAIIEELYHSFPPENPGFAGVPLKNTHYLYHLFAAATEHITRISIVPLYYYFLPALVSLLFGLGIYAVGTIVTKDFRIQVLTIILGFLCGNAAYFVPLFLGKNFDWKGNTFFADQPFDQLTNPYTVFGFVLFLFGVYWWFKATNKQLNLQQIVFATLLFAVSYGFKSFAGVIALPAVIGVSVILTILKRDKKYLLVSGLFLILFIPLLFLTTTFGSVGLRWSPGWLLREMMTSADKLNLPAYADKEDFYLQSGNWLGLVKVKFIELAIYLIGNLGIRLVGLITLFSSITFMLIKKRGHELLSVSLLITFIILTGLSLPLLFNLGASAHNIIQFTPYALLFLVFPTVYAIEKVWRWLHKRVPLLATLFVILAVALAVPVNLKNISQKINSPGNLIPQTDLEAFSYLRTQTPRNSVIAVDITRYEIAPIQIAALGNRRMYLAETGFAEQTGNDPRERMTQLQEFFQNNNFQKLEQNGVTHIFMLQSHLGKEKEIVLTMSGLTKVFSNQDVAIFAHIR